jgi:AcrR family transcriptional regulator
MESLLSTIKINVNPKVYLKDPESSELGQNIISNSIILIDKLGLEDFNFKKLATLINSNESSIYRYFENKYRLLQYLSSLYWGILEYRIVFDTNAIKDPKEKLLKALKILTLKPENIPSYSSLDQLKLRDIIISEFTKSYHNKHVDSDNNEGKFRIYKRLNLRIAEMITLVSPNYAYPKSLASQIIEGATQQQFMRIHFPTLTEQKNDMDVYAFFKDIVINVLNIKIEKK